MRYPQLCATHGFDGLMVAQSVVGKTRWPSGPPFSLIPATWARVEMAFQGSSSYLWLGTYLSAFQLTLPR
jgi:hypothetical protein